MGKVLFEGAGEISEGVFIFIPFSFKDTKLVSAIMEKVDLKCWSSSTQVPREP